MKIVLPVGGRSVEFGTGIRHNQTYAFVRIIVCKVIISNMVTVRNLEVACDILNTCNTSITFIIRLMHSIIQKLRF